MCVCVLNLFKIVRGHQALTEIPKYHFKTSWFKKSLSLAVWQGTKMYKIIFNSAQDAIWLCQVFPEKVLTIEMWTSF